MDLRAREAELKIDFDKPLDGFLELQRFTFDYFEKNPRFEGLLRNENLHARQVRGPVARGDRDRLPAAPHDRAADRERPEARACSGPIWTPCRST
jgi:hypothetical protein